MVTAGAMTVPGLPGSSQVPGGKTVSITWSSVSSATNYVVLHHTAAAGGTTTTACATSGTSCIDPNARVATAWYSVQARVGSSWLTESARVIYVPDLTTPTPTMTSLASDTGVNTSDFITNTTTNNLHGTSEPNATVAIMRGGISIATATANGAGAWTSTAFTLTEGLQDLDVTATDAYANTASATGSNIRLDTVAPTTSRSATCTTPGNAAPTGNWCKQTTLSMSATFSDGGSGLQTGTAQYNDNGVGWTDYVTALTLLEANGRVVQLRATDVAGNVGTTSVTYYIDGTAPAVIVTYPNAGISVNLVGLLAGLGTNCTSAQSACGTAIDLVSGTASAAWNLQRSNLSGSPCMNASGSYSTANCSSYFAAGLAGSNWSIDVTPGTAYGGLTLLTTFTLKVHATDSAGNTSGDTAVSFTLIL